MSELLRAAIFRSKLVPHPAKPVAPDRRDERIRELEAQVDQLKDKIRDLEEFGTLVPRLLTVGKAVCDHYGVTMEQIRSEARAQELVDARYAAFYLCRTLRPSPYSYCQIGRVFGRDHTTVIHGAGKAERMIKEGGIFAADIDTIRRRFATKGEDVINWPITI